MTWVVGVGTSLWVVAGLGLLAAHLFLDRPLGVWFGACVAGSVLGLLGYALFRWQRHAARLGHRGAQAGVE
jgi:hypothetical protein